MKKEGAAAESEDGLGEEWALGKTISVMWVKHKETDYMCVCVCVRALVWPGENCSSSPPLNNNGQRDEEQG